MTDSSAIPPEHLEPPDPIVWPGEKRTWLQKNLRPIAGLVTVGGVMGLYYVIVIHVLHGVCPPEQKDLLLIILGALPGIMGYVLQFCFGSSQGGEKIKGEVGK
jgi:hypothetical protein